MAIANPLDCRSWYVTPELLAYHDRAWGRPVHDDCRLFEMICLEGASVGLSWRTIWHRREAYRRLFHGFDVDACASMDDAELEAARHAGLRNSCPVTAPKSAPTGNI